jgi:hypothetical protein
MPYELLSVVYGQTTPGFAPDLHFGRADSRICVEIGFEALVGV